MVPLPQYVMHKIAIMLHLLLLCWLQAAAGAAAAAASILCSALAASSTAACPRRLHQVHEHLVQPVRRGLVAAGGQGVQHHRDRLAAAGMHHICKACQQHPYNFLVLLSLL